MSRRGRASLLALAALSCAAAAAAISSGYRSAAESQYGPLRPALIATAPVAADEQVTPALARRSFTVRRIPERFIPPGTLVNAAEAVGLRAQAPLTPGSYVIGALLAPPQSERRAPGVAAGLRPVEIAVTGGAALTVSGSAEPGPVDVVVSESPLPGKAGRTYVAATAVTVLALRGPAGPGDAGRWSATLALTREQALDLIAAENFAREIRLLPRG